jgi:hypothetical protein
MGGLPRHEMGEGEALRLSTAQFPRRKDGAHRLGIYRPRGRRRIVGDCRESPSDRSRPFPEAPAPVRLVPSERIQITANLSRAGLSGRVVRQHHANALKSLARLGISSDRVPPIVVRHGAGVAVKPRLQGGFVVTFPRFERTPRPQAQSAYRLALGCATLESHRKTQGRGRNGHNDQLLRHFIEPS